MKVKFKDNKEPCIEYQTDGKIIDEYDEVQKRYCKCMLLKGLGYVWADLLEETTGTNNIDAKDIYVELTNQKATNEKFI